MDRREFLATATAGTGLGLMGAALGGLAGARVARGADGDASAEALRELSALLDEIERRYLGPEWGVTDALDRAMGRRFVLHALQHALEAWLEADPVRPVFTRFVTPTKRLLGDNPDAIYYTAPVDPRRGYRIRGSIAGATYTSFTVENGTRDGHGARALGAALNDAEFEIRADGSYELIASPHKQAGSWLRLDPESGTITTRHYFEWERSAAADPSLHVPLVIEPLDPPGPPSPADDASLAAGMRRVANFLRAVTLEMPPRSARAQQPSWVSLEPNVFPDPEIDESNQAIGFAARDNVYSMAPYALGPDEALVIRGRFPRCRFANVVVWTRFGQTLDYAHRQTSLNRRQTRLEPDGSFRMVLAHRDPGVPNWLDTEGRPRGDVFWRFQLPEEDPPPIRSEVVPFSAIRAG